MSGTDVARGRVALTRGKRLLFAAVVTTAAVTLAVVAAEVGLRIAGWRAPGFYVEGHGPLGLRHVDRRGGPYPPGDGELIGFSFAVPWHINGDGFRERERLPKRAGEVRVGLLGDSILAGWGVGVGERFSDVWSAPALATGGELTIWNLGAPGAGTAQLADVLGGVGQRYEFDSLVLALFAGNELGDNSRRYAADGQGKEDEERWSVVRDLLRNHSRLALYLWLHGGHGLLFRLEAEPPLPVRFSRQWPATQRALETFREAAGDRPLTVLYLPAREEWDDDYWASQVAVDPTLAGRRWVMRDAVLGWCTGHALPFLDATPALLQRPVEEVKFPGDGHWTAAGQRRVGDYLNATAGFGDAIAPAPRSGR